MKETFTAIRPCTKCGTADRYKDGKCKACVSARTSIYRAKNPKKGRARVAAWRKANPGRASASAAAWVKANPEKKRASDAAWQEANPGRKKATGATWNEANKEKVKSAKAAYNKANPEKVKAYGAAWRAANHEKIRVTNAARYIADQEKIRARVAGWRLENPEKVKAASAAWYVANPDAARIGRQNRRARVRSVGGVLSKGLSDKLFKLQKGICPCCKQPLSNDFHLDHKMPLALGGSNTDDNMQLLRATCNQQKQAKHPVDFMQSRGYLL